MILSILLCAAASLFCSNLVSVHVSVQWSYGIAGSTHALHIGLFRQIARCVKRSCHDSSWYLFVLVIFLEAVVLPQVGLYMPTKPSMFSVGTMFTLIGVLYTIITLTFAMFNFISICLLSSISSCNVVIFWYSCA